MRYELVIFDLDGTLVDSLRDIANAMNHSLRTLDMPEHGLEAYRQFVGEGADVLAAKALPADRQDLQPQALMGFKEYYKEHFCDHTRPYPGIETLLDELLRRQVALAVLSNKPDPATRLVVNRLLSDWPFAAVAGQKPDVPRKPDPAGALLIAKELEISPDRALLVGDSRIDMQTAVAAKMFAVGCSWGFRDRLELREHGAAMIIDEPLQLLTLIDDDG